MHLITALGTGDYKSAYYNFSSKVHPTRLFPVALAQWFDFEQIHVLLTAAAREKWYCSLERELGSSHADKLNPLDIPDGSSEQQLWEIFDVLTSAIPANTEVVFDITHAFRSLPLISFLSAAYLRVAKGIHIRHLLYGAYEAKADRDNPESPVPVFDLSPMLELLSWLSAAEQFSQTGSSELLADLLEQLQNQAHQPGRSGSKPRTLKSLASALDVASQSLLLARPLELRQRMGQLTERLDSAQQEADEHARPFALLHEQAQQLYSPLADDSLAGQHRLVNWYMQHGHYLQAAALARELLVSYAVTQLYGPRALDAPGVKAIREAAEAELWGQPPAQDPATRSDWQTDKALRNLWSELANTRNDLLHCGMARRQLNEAETLLKRLRKAVAALAALDLPTQPWKQ
jgi:CRISPR-associated DxTHG motif protein